jgi:hypothetical protein
MVSCAERTVIVRFVSGTNSAAFVIHWLFFAPCLSDWCNAKALEQIDAKGHDLFMSRLRMQNFPTSIAIPADLRNN